MKKIVNLFIVLLVLSSCSLDETQMPINVPKTDTIIDEEEIINEVVALRNDLFGQPTKSISGIEITALSPLTKSSDITPYVVNYPDNGGYAVVVAESDKIDIIAITSNGYLPSELLYSEMLNGASNDLSDVSDIWDNSSIFPDASDDYIYGDEHIPYFPMDNDLFELNESSGGEIIPHNHPSIAIIAEILNGYDDTDDNISTNPENPIYPPGTEPVDSSLIGVWRPIDVVGSLIKTKWNQSGVYQQACPIMPNGNRALVGCVGVATAQIVAYLAPPSLPFNWNRLVTLGNFIGSTINNATEKDKVMVANYLRYVADEVNTNYSDTASSANRNDVCNFLLNDVLCEEVVVHNLETSNNVVARMKDRLKLHLPFYMEAYELEADGEYSGHAFVVDGLVIQEKYVTPYRSIVRNLFHINWGWGGKADGYYLLSGLCRDGRIATDPHIDSGQNTSGNFNYHDYIRIVTYKTPSWW